MIEAVPDAVQLTKKRWVEGRTELMLIDVTGTSTDGMPVVWPLVSVLRARPDGRLDRGAYFPIDRWDDALAQFDEWAAGSRPGAAAPAAPTTPAALAQPVSEAFAARDWEWIRGRVTSDVVLEDRRSTVSSHRAVGADAVTDLFRGFADVGFETLDNIHVASRGTGVVLLRRIYRSSAGFELEMLAVVETDADGLWRSLVLFDADAMVPALDELEIRYARSGLLTPSERQVMLGFVAVNHRAWEELDAVLAPGVTTIDHRRLGLSHRRRERVLRPRAPRARGAGARPRRDRRTDRVVGTRGPCREPSGRDLGRRPRRRLAVAPRVLDGR